MYARPQKGMEKGFENVYNNHYEKCLSASYMVGVRKMAEDADLEDGRIISVSIKEGTL